MDPDSALIYIQSDREKVWWVKWPMCPLLERPIDMSYLDQQ